LSIEFIGQLSSARRFLKINAGSADPDQPTRISSVAHMKKREKEVERDDLPRPQGFTI
jgi:hypothetical protein